MQHYPLFKPRQKSNIEIKFGWENGFSNFEHVHHTFQPPRLSRETSRNIRSASLFVCSQVPLPSCELGNLTTLYGALQPRGRVAPVWRTWSLVRSYMIYGFLGLDQLTWNLNAYCWGFWLHYQMSSDIVDEPCAYSVFEFHAPEEYWLSFSEGDNIQYIHFGGIWIFHETEAFTKSVQNCISAS